MTGETLVLSVAKPFDADYLLAYLKPRELAGVEEVRDGRYRRSIRVGTRIGELVVDLTEAAGNGRVSVSCSEDLGPSNRALEVMVSNLIDADAPVAEIDAHLRADPVLAPLLERRAGIRIPGTVDPFELAVRAVLGQQVSVAAASTFASRVAGRWGTPVASVDGLFRAFPVPEELVEAPLEEIGLSRSRAGAIRALASSAVGGGVVLSPGRNATEAEEALLGLPGIGPWTASYISLRGLRNRDAIPVSDLGIRQALGCSNAKEVMERSERWRPWRGYAAALLWSTYLPL